MYVTRPYSKISKKSLEEVPEGPNLGFLLIGDVDTKVVPCCFGFCKREVHISPVTIYNNFNLTFAYNGSYGVRKPIILIPVLNQPLSSNRYYAIDGEGRYKGEAITCGRKKIINKQTVEPRPVNPMPLDPQNIYQQVEIFRARDGCYDARSAASDGSYPYFLLRNLNTWLIVGKWYCPFMFVREGRIRDQVERSMYYEITLEQRWEQVFRCKKSSDESSPVTFEVEKEEVFIAGMCKAMWSEKNVADDGVIWFTSCGTELGGCSGLGLRVEVVERMKWEQESGGWKNGKDFKVPVKIESHKRKEEWNEFGCYVLKRSMYVTRSSSEISKRSLAEVPEGPNLGFLLIKDAGTKFARDVCTKANYTLAHMTFRKSIILIPVLNQPLSSNRFYAIAGEGRYKGEAFSCRKNIKINKITVDLPLDTKPLNPQNIYQQVEIFRSAYLYEPKSVAPDGSNPYIYDCKEWCLHVSPPHHFELSEARGINSTLLIVGKWYCPFMFVREGRIRDQVERSMYYEITLEQRWEQVFRCKKSSDESSPVTFEVEKEEVFIAGMCIAMWSEKNVADDGVVWFTSCGTELGGCSGLGLRVEVVERMKWEQESGGWKNGKDFKVPVKIESHKRKEEWNEFGCYVLVERFNLRRMDGTLAMAYDFKHTHQIKTIWE
ncbi:hypothetical protein ACJIZ3_009942 [Penstemon smallii]|uniref:Uncharacterized protein n=1 Tax=Penstemon smallii TaxID=265156 RepID=A0ABD3TDY0_9LAMI